METIGILSLLPPILAVALALITKQVVPSLFAAVWIGATILHGFNPIVGIFEAFREFVIPALGDPDNAGVVVLCWFCGSFAYLMERGGGAHAFATAITKVIKSSKGAKIVSAVGGTVIFFSDSTNPVLVGPIFKPITDSLKVPREKLAYIVDATTATMPSMFFFTAWGAYICSILAQQFEEIPYEGTAVQAFNAAVPFMFYTIGAVVFCYVVNIFDLDFGPMKKAEMRAKTTGKLLDDNDASEALLFKVELPEGAKPTILDMIIPLVVLLIGIFGGILWTGGFPEVGVAEAFANASTTKSIVFGFFIGSITAMIMSVKSKVYTPKESVNAFISGIKQMTEAMLILVLAWSIGSVCKAVGTTAFVISITQGFLTPTMMFAAVFAISAFTAFCTGTSWGTFAIYIPIAVPLAYAIGAPIPAAIGVAVAGGIFGDHCSPISDTTVLSSMGSGCNHIAHVRTQLPYAVSVAVSAFVAYIVVGLSYQSLGIGAASAVGIVITIVLSCVIAFVLGRVGGSDTAKA